MTRPPDQAKELDNFWLQKMQEGVVVTIHIGWWRGRTKLTYQDLGIPMMDKDISSLIDLGSKFLLPAEYIRRMGAIESSARKYLAREAIPTFFYGYFVPYTKYEKVVTKGLERYRQDLFSLADDLQARWGEITAEHLVTCEVAAREAYQRLSRLTPKFKASGTYLPEDDFVQRYVGRVKAAMPAADEFRASVRFDVQVGYIPLPSQLAENFARAKKIEAQAEVERARARLEATRLAAKEAAERAEAELRRLREEQAISIEEAALAKREAMLAAMHRDVVEQARRRKEEEIDSFIRDVRAKLASVIYEAATDVMEAIKKNGGFHQKSVAQLKNLVSAISELNFFGDAESDKMMQAVRQRLEEIQTKQANPNSVSRTLENIAVLTRQQLLSLGESPRSARHLGIPDQPNDGLVRTARRALDLDLDVPTEELPSPRGAPRGARSF